MSRAGPRAPARQLANDGGAGSGAINFQRIQAGSGDTKVLGCQENSLTVAVGGSPTVETSETWSVPRYHITDAI